MVGLRFGDRMHALPAPEVKSGSEQYQCFVCAIPIIFERGRLGSGSSIPTHPGRKAPGKAIQVAQRASEALAAHSTGYCCPVTRRGGGPRAGTGIAATRA